MVEGEPDRLREILGRIDRELSKGGPGLPAEPRSIRPRPRHGPRRPVLRGPGPPENRPEPDLRQEAWLAARDRMRIADEALTSFPALPLATGLALFAAALALLPPAPVPDPRESLSPHELRRNGPARIPAAAIAFPALSPGGVSAAGGRYSVFDRSTGEIVTLDPGAGTVVSRTPFPNPAAAGVSLGPDAVWSTDALGGRAFLSPDEARHSGASAPLGRASLGPDEARHGGPGASITPMEPGTPGLRPVRASAPSGRIFRHDPKTYRITAEFRSLGPSPGAVHWDGSYLWVHDRKKGTVVRHAGDAALSPLSESPVDAKRAAAITRVGNHLWILDPEARAIHRYEIGISLRPAGRALLDFGPDDASAPDGVSPSGRWIWVVSHPYATLRRIPADAISFTDD